MNDKNDAWLIENITAVVKTALMKQDSATHFGTPDTAPEPEDVTAEIMAVFYAHLMSN